VKDISPQLQNQIAQYQQLQNQLQVLGSQRVQLEAKLREIEGTLEELGKIKDDTPVYKSIGMLLVKQDDREALKKELEEHKETLTIRVKSLQKQEKALTQPTRTSRGKSRRHWGARPRRRTQADSLPWTPSQPTAFRFGSASTRSPEERQ